MYPYINLGFVKIDSYYLMAGVGFIAYLFMLIFYFEKVENNKKSVTNRALILSVAGFASLYIFALLFDCIFHSIEEGKFTIGTITWLGGVVGMIPTMLFLLHFLLPGGKGNEIHYLSLIIPGVVLGHGFGRIGCFLAGCCYGAETDCFLGVTFPGMTHAVVPTQLIEAVFEFALFAVMILGRKKFKEYNIELYLIPYGIFRFILEFFRGDNRGSTGFALTPSQVLSLVCIAFAVLLLLYQKGVIFKKLHEKIDGWKEPVEPAENAVTEDTTEK